jgi:hypothetical protein
LFYIKSLVVVFWSIFVFNLSFRNLHYKHFPVLFSFMTYHRDLSLLSLVEQELLTLPEHLSMFCRSLFVLLYFFFFFWALCSSSIYRFWLPPFGILDLQILITSLWYLQTLPTVGTISCNCSEQIHLDRKLPD